MRTKKNKEPYAHGYLIAGGAADISRVYEFLNARGIETQGNPDVFLREYKSFGADDARMLRERAMMRPVESSHRIFIIVTPSMTSESQNALLKTLEEPPADAVFFFIVPTPIMLLGTLRSRMQILEPTPASRKRRLESGIVDARAFLSAAAEKRLDMLKPLYQKDDSDERDIRNAMDFLSELEHAIASQSRHVSREDLSPLYRARKFIADKGSLLKPLLEQMALLIPRSIV